MDYSPLAITSELIKKESVTPVDAGAIDLLIQYLEPLGFKCHKMVCDDTTNLYARLGSNGKNFAFAGHTDVVPTGDVSHWSSPPFAPTVRDEILYGRGAVDMKGAIGCFIAAIKQLLDTTPNPEYSISLIITGDEEGNATNGTVKILEWLKEQNEQVDYCIVGEPTNPERIGEMIKIGRRGSVSFSLKVIGKQGHVAYPHNADNPITSLIKVLNLLKDYQFDRGNDYFDATNLEVTNIEVGNEAGNVIPGIAKAAFNIRFNDQHSSNSLIKLVQDVCDKTVGKYELDYRITGESFLTAPSELTEIVSNAVKQVTGKAPEQSTTGGTSDARFIKDICPVVECGLINKTAHQIDEHIAIGDLEKLTKIYLNILENTSK